MHSFRCFRPLASWSCTWIPSPIARDLRGSVLIAVLLRQHSVSLQVASRIIAHRLSTAIGRGSYCIAVRCIEFCALGRRRSPASTQRVRSSWRYYWCWQGQHTKGNRLALIQGRPLGSRLHHSSQPQKTGDGATNDQPNYPNLRLGSVHAKRALKGLFREGGTCREAARP